MAPTTRARKTGPATKDKSVEEKRPAAKSKKIAAVPVESESGSDSGSEEVDSSINRSQRPQRKGAGDGKGMAAAKSRARAQTASESEEDDIDRSVMAPPKPLRGKGKTAPLPPEKAKVAGDKAVEGKRPGPKSKTSAVPAEPESDSGDSDSDEANTSINRSQRPQPRSAVTENGRAAATSRARAQTASESEEDDIDRSVMAPPKPLRGKGKTVPLLPEKAKAAVDKAVVGKRPGPKSKKSAVPAEPESDSGDSDEANNSINRSQRPQPVTENVKAATTSRARTQTASESEEDDIDRTIMAPPKPPRGKGKPLSVLVAKAKAAGKSVPPKGRGTAAAAGKGTKKSQAAADANASISVGRPPLRSVQVPDHSASHLSVAATTAASSILDETTEEEGLTKRVKNGINEFIKRVFDDAQRASASGRKKLYKEFRKVFYKIRSETLTHEYQKYIVQCFWRWAILFFKAPNSGPVQAALKFITHVTLTAGTEEEHKDIGFEFETLPMYYFIVKLILLSHMDGRPNVRMRVMALLHRILEKFKDDNPIQRNSKMRKEIVDCLQERVKDKNVTVRAVSSLILTFFAESSSDNMKQLKFTSRFDPHPESRRVVVSNLAGLQTVKTTFFYEHIFDPDQRVRAAAFTCLASRSVALLSSEERTKCLLWGLSHDDQCKTIVKEKLIPSWVQQCDNDPIAFLKNFIISNRPKMVQQILDAMYPNNFTETFQAINLSFLNEEKVIPIQKITIEAIMYWAYLAEKFGHDRFNKERLLPNADVMLNYFKSIITAIHKEHRQAVEDDRDEDATLIFCLPYLISMMFKIGLEEGNRRLMTDLLKDVLTDSVLDEAPLIKCCVDALFKIMDKRTFTEKMAEIFQLVFEPDPTLVDRSGSATPRRTPAYVSRPGSRMSSQNENGAHLDGSPPKSTHGSEEEMQVDDVNDGADLPGSSKSKKSDRPERRAFTEAEILKMKNKLCNLAVQRFRLGQTKDTALKDNNYLEAHGIQQEIEKVVEEEKLLRKRMENNEGRVGSMSDFTISSKSSGLNLEETSMMEMEIADTPSPAAQNVEETDAPVIPSQPSRPSSATPRAHQGHGDDEDVDFPCSQATTVGGFPVGVTSQNICSGVVMMNRFLTCSPKITPFVRTFFDQHAFPIFTDQFQDRRTRKEILCFLSLVGMIDRQERRKIMGLILTALAKEPETELRVVALKAMVDLLCHYQIQDWLCPGDDAELRYDCISEIFYKPDATPAELQGMFMSVIEKFGHEDVIIPESQSLRTSAMMKLVIANRIATESSITEILCMWVNPANEGTNIPYRIGIWLPIYTQVSAQNAKLVGKSLLASVKRILSAHDGKVKFSYLKDADFLKLVDFVVPCLSSRHAQQKDGEYLNVHEDLYASIIQGIVANPGNVINVDLVQILPKLSVEDTIVAERIVADMVVALTKLATMLQTSTVSSIKNTLKKCGKKIATQFEDIRDSVLESLAKVDEIRAPTFDNTSDDDDANDNDDVCQFSSDDERENRSKSKTVNNERGPFSSSDSD